MKNKPLPGFQYNISEFPMRIAPYFVTIIILLFLSGCSDDSKSTSNESEHENGDFVDLRAIPPLGLKWTTHTSKTIHYSRSKQKSKDEGSRIEEHSLSEVIAVEGNALTVKEDMNAPDVY